MIMLNTFVGFDAFKEELGTSRDSSMQRGLSLDVSYDEQDLMKVCMQKYAVINFQRDLHLRTV